jgi:hypothetical protein
MIIRINAGTQRKYVIYLEATDRVEYLKILFFQKFPHFDRDHEAKFVFKGQILQNGKRLSDYDISDNCMILLNSSSISGGYIDNLKEESKTQIAKKIGFDMELIKRDELNINLIHFDLNMTNGENYIYILIILKQM